MEFDPLLLDLIKRDKRYTLQAYRFVNEALYFAIKRREQELAAISEQFTPPGTPHVTGQDVCYAVRDYALEQFGFLALTVLHEFGIKRTSDIGQIVFNLIEIKLMSKNDEDTIEDFDDVFDLADELDHGFRFLK